MSQENQIQQLQVAVVVGRAMMIDAGIISGSYYVVSDGKGNALMPSRSKGLKLRPLTMSVLGFVRKNPYDAGQIAAVWNKAYPSNKLTAMPWREALVARISAIEKEITELMAKQTQN